MGLKNYTTKIEVEKTMMEIEKILAKHGATHIYKMYGSDGEPKALAFKIMVQDQLLPFKLPMEEDKIYEVFRQQHNQGEIPKRYVDRKQAKRTGWRIIKDWVDSQMALVKIHLVKFEEVFLPYMYDEKRNETLFQKFERKGYEMLTHEEKEERF